METRLKSLQSLWIGEARLVRAEIAKHVERITLPPEGRPYTSGTWDLLGCVAVTMVPGARHARYCHGYSLGWRREASASQNFPSFGHWFDSHRPLHKF